MTVGKHEATVVVKGESSGASKALDQASKSVTRLEGKLAKADAASKKLAQSNGAAFSKLQSTLKKTQVDADRFTKAWDSGLRGGATKSTDGLLRSVTALRAGVAGLAIGGTVAAVNKIRELGAESLKLQNVFSNLPFSLDGARAATLGLVDDAALATAAVTAQRFGVAKNAEEFAKLASAATKLSITTGQEASKGISDLTTALSRQSPMILDNLGITLRLSEAHARYAVRLGKSTAELTENEKAEAFRVEAMAAAQEATRGLTIETDGLAASLSKAEVSAKNLTTALLTGGETGPGGMQPWEAMEKLAVEAADAAAAFDTLADAARDGNPEQRKTVQSFIDLRAAMAGSATFSVDLEKTNKILAELGSDIALNAHQASGEFLKALDSSIQHEEVMRKINTTQREALRADGLAKEFAIEELAIAKEQVGEYQFKIKLARAQGQSEAVILGIQQAQLVDQRALVQAKADVGELDLAQLALENDKLDQQALLLEALIKKTRTRGSASRRASKDIVKGLVEEAQMGKDAIASREASADLAMLFHEQETAGMDGTLAQREALQLQRERELDFIIGDDLPAMQERINKENEILQLQIEAAALSEEMAFTAADREEAAGAREQLLHEQKVKRLVDEKQLKEEMAAQLDRDRQKQLDNSVAVLGIQKNFMAGFGKIAIEGAKHRGASEKAVFNAEKAIKSASLSLDAITYGAKAAAAFAAGNFISGAGNTVAAGIAAASAIQTLALTPDSARGSAGASGGAAAATTPDRGGDAPPSSAVPASAAEGRGATLPNGAGPSAGGGVSVTIGTFTTLGTVDDETGTKLAHAIERVKADGLT